MSRLLLLLALAVILTSALYSQAPIHAEKSFHLQDQIQPSVFSDLDVNYNDSGLFPGLFDSDNDRKKYYIEFKFGKLDPEDTGSGNLYGFSTGKRIDSRLWWGFMIDYFNSTYRQETTIADSVVGGIRFREKQLELEFNTRILTLLGQISYERGIGNEKNGPFFYRASGGIGWELIWNNEENFEEGIERQRFFNGLGWQLSTGLGLAISETGMIFADLFYNNSVANRNQDRDEEGLPVWEEINVSGLGIKVGINVLGLIAFR